MSIKHYQFTQIEKQLSEKYKQNQIRNGIVKNLLAKYQPSKGFNNVVNTQKDKLEKIAA